MAAGTGKCISSVTYTDQGFRTFAVLIPGKPVPWQRPRFNNGQGFMPKEMKDALDHFRWHLLLQMKQQRIPLSSPHPCIVKITFHYAAPKKKHGPKTTRPDIDNLEKFVLDAGNGVLWMDDGQVCEVSKAKYWGHTDETRIAATWIEPSLSLQYSESGESPKPYQL